jgi:hypothetical protein
MVQSYETPKLSDNAQILLKGLSVSKSKEILVYPLEGTLRITIDGKKVGSVKEESASQDETLSAIQELTKNGFIKKMDQNGYRYIITEAGYKKATLIAKK